MPSTSIAAGRTDALKRPSGCTAPLAMELHTAAPCTRVLALPPVSCRPPCPALTHLRLSKAAGR